MNERQTKIVHFALAFLKSNLDSEVEDQLTNSIGESKGSLTIEKEIEQVQEALPMVQPNPPMPLPVSSFNGDEFGGVATYGSLGDDAELPEGTDDELKAIEEKARKIARWFYDEEKARKSLTGKRA